MDLPTCHYVIGIFSTEVLPNNLSCFKLTKEKANQDKGQRTYLSVHSTSTFTAQHSQSKPYTRAVGVDY